MPEERQGEGPANSSDDATATPWAGYDASQPNAGRAPRATRDQVDARIEHTRQLLVDGRNCGDIKRILSKQYGLTGNGAAWYIRHARRRNRPALHLKGDEAAVLSVTWWRQQQQSASSDLATLNKELASYIEREKIVEGLLDENLANEWAHVEAGRVAKKIDSIRRAIGAATTRAAKAQDRIDMILGNKAPVKLAITDKDGNDLPRDPRVLETRLVALGFALPALPDGTGGGLSQLPTLPTATRLEASARRLDSRE